MRGPASGIVAAVLMAVAALASGSPLQPMVITDPVATDADDPAIWRHPSDPTRSLILGTNKSSAPQGALVVFGLDGKPRQTIAGLDRPNNVDVEQNVRFGKRRFDLAVVTERNRRRLRIFQIHLDGRLKEVSGKTGVFQGEAGDLGAPMGVSLYHRSQDGALFAVVSRKSGPDGSYLHQYRLAEVRPGTLDTQFVRKFGRVSQGGEIEALCVDDLLGWVYVADEQFGIRKYHADPAAPRANTELAVFARTGFQGDREGIAIVPTGPQTGFVAVCDQHVENSRLHLYRREGEPGRPHEHSREFDVIHTGSDETDGIDAASGSFGPTFPRGIFAMMDSKGRSFRLFDLGSLSSRTR